MNKTIQFSIIIGAIAVIIVVSAARPDWLGDKNGFLINFVNHELLNILGVILAITLASLGQIHLKLNEIEEKINEIDGGENKISMSNSRTELKSSATWLIILFSAAVVLVVVKPLVISCGVSSSFINGGALWILLFNVLILADVTRATFRIGPVIKK